VPWKVGSLRAAAMSSVAGAEPQLREFYELAPREGALAVTGDRGAVRKRVVGRKEVFRQFGEILARASKGLQVVSVDAGVDYRQRSLKRVQVYHCPLGAAADAAKNAAFETMAEAAREMPAEERIAAGFKHALDSRKCKNTWQLEYAS
jgi:hypothetical protein